MNKDNFNFMSKEKNTGRLDFTSDEDDESFDQKRNRYQKDKVKSSAKFGEEGFLEDLKVNHSKSKTVKP